LLFFATLPLTVFLLTRFRPYQRHDGQASTSARKRICSCFAFYTCLLTPSLLPHTSSLRPRFSILGFTTLPVSSLSDTSVISVAVTSPGALFRDFSALFVMVWELSAESGWFGLPFGERTEDITQRFLSSQWFPGFSRPSLVFLLYKTRLGNSPPFILLFPLPFFLLFAFFLGDPCCSHVGSVVAGLRTLGSSDGDMDLSFRLKSRSVVLQKTTLAFFSPFFRFLNSVLSLELPALSHVNPR